MTDTQKIADTTEAWESGELGNDERYVRRASKELEKELDDSLGTQAISIRLPKELIQDLKFLAKYNDMGYQPLIRQVLTRFVEGEYKRVAIETARKLEQAERDKQRAEEALQERKAA